VLNLHEAKSNFDNNNHGLYSIQATVKKPGSNLSLTVSTVRENMIHRSSNMSVIHTKTLGHLPGCRKMFSGTFSDDVYEIFMLEQFTSWKHQRARTKIIKNHPPRTQVYRQDCVT